VLATEEAPEPSRERWPFIVSCVGMKDERTLWRGQICSFLVCERAPDQCGRDGSYLISVDKPESMLRLDGDPVEEVQLRDLENVLDSAELGVARAQDHGSNWQGLV